jgi:4-amino-4-deoxy-L-arabinose transferase-like glycosyltransferase
MPRWFPVAAPIIFTLLGLAFIDQAGIQNDEALFAPPVFEPGSAFHRIRVFGHDIPLMTLSYLGAWKSWFYWPIFHLFPPTLLSLRLPTLLLGAASILLFFNLLRRTGYAGAALGGTALLATDPVYLLTSLFDWGPVAFQHLFFLASVDRLADFSHTGRRRSLALAGVALGRGLWDKALFLWPLLGLITAALLFYHADLRRILSPGNLRVLLAASLLAALPLLLYNIRRKGATIEGNARFTTSEYASKFVHVRVSANGSAMFGFLNYDEWQRPVTEAGTPLGRAAWWLRQRAGEQRYTWTIPAFFLALGLAPFWWRSPARRPLLATLVFFATGWFLMASTRDAGGAAHHVMLLWPAPHFFIALAFAAAAERLPRLRGPALAAVFVLLCGKQLLVLNQHRVQFERNGAAGHWNLAILPLSDLLGTLGASRIYILDWGMIDPLRMLHRGRLPVEMGSEPLMHEETTDRDAEAITRMIADPRAVFVSHTPAFEEFRGVPRRLDRFAAAHGYVRSPIRTLADPQGRPVFEVYRFAAAGPAAAVP